MQVQFVVNRMLNRVRMQLMVPADLSYREREREPEYINMPRVSRVLLSIERENEIGYTSTVCSQLERVAFEKFSAKVLPVLRKLKTYNRDEEGHAMVEVNA